MKLIPAGALYSPRVTIVHSLEFLGHQADVSSLKAAQGTNGSIGNSPAATAFYYSESRDPQALAYLKACLNKNGGASVPVLHPCENYELLWSAYHLNLADIPASELLDETQIDSLNQALDNGGVSLSPSFPIPDADDTAVALLFLHELGQSPDPRILEYYATPDGHFASFQYERHSSVGVSLHVLHALLRVPGYPGGKRTIIRILDYLASQQIDGLYWIDKWHISPYYATAHALCILNELDSRMAHRMSPLVEQSREWIRQTQNEDGSWGFYNKPTLEETAYALLALTAGATASLSSYDRTSCDKAAHYIQAQLKGAQVGTSADLFPPLWIDKCLYRPALIVQAVITAALEAYRSVSDTEYYSGEGHEYK
ncbi:MAG: prenyltransferase/squalene oxidase repeat-containing protein [Chloroflexota bacterium]